MNKWSNVARRMRIPLCARRVVVGAAMVAGAGWGTAQAAPPDVVATYTVTTQTATCDLQLMTPATLTLGDVRKSDVMNMAKPGQSQGKVITLKLINCVGIGGSKVPKVTVYGDRDGVTDATLYRKSTSQATGVGFMLTQDTDGAGKALTAGTQASPTKVQVPGTNGSTNPNNKTIDFFVQVSKGTQAASGVGDGLLTATLHFDFKYD